MTPDYYLPIISGESRFPFARGVQLEFEGIQPQYEAFMSDRWVYHIPIRWDICESEKGKIVFPPYLDYSLAVLSGAPLIIGVKNAPEWARSRPRVCSMPKPEFYVNFVNFCEAVAEKMNPVAMEIGNEPDVFWVDAPAPEYFGCASDGAAPEDFYKAGSKYAGLVNSVKGAIGSTPIICGALLESKDFAKGMKAEGIQADIFSFHNYLYRGTPFENSLQEAMLYQDILGLPVIMTETSVKGVTDTELLRQAQSDYAEFLIANQFTEALQIELILWYTLGDNNWYNTGLIRGGATPAWEVWK